MKRALKALLRPLRRSRALLACVVAITLLSLVLCVTPGFDALNYYSGLAIGFIGSLLAGVSGIALALEARERHANPFIAALWGALWLAAIPLLVLTLNALRVTNCDPLEGLAFYSVGGAFSLGFAAQLGAFCALLAPRWRGALPLYAAAFLTWAAFDVWHIVHHPPIFAYNPFAGFFSGAIYDTVIRIEPSLLLYRLHNVLQLAVLWTLVALARDRAAGRLTARGVRAAGWERWALVVLAVLAVAVSYGFRGFAGWQIDRADVERVLGGRVANDRVTIYYDAATISTREADALLEDHVYRLDSLADALGEPYPHHVTSYVYGGRDQKRYLMGAGDVYIAKPWLREIHLNRVSYGDTVIHHELAHVVLGVYATPPFEVPTAACVLPLAALVEGAAEAFEWDTGPLTPHQWAAAMRRADIAPPLATLLGPDGFYTAASGKAYTVSGSFIRWLIDTRGIDRFKGAYRDGDFETAYTTPLVRLLAAWEAYIDEVALPPEAEALARYRFHQKAVFFRTCPLDVARAESEAAQLLHRGEREAALRYLYQVLDWVPGDPQKWVPVMRVAADMGDVDRAEAAYAAYHLLSGRNAASDALMTELLADVLWRAGRRADASTYYATLVGVPQDDDRLRNVLVKARVVDDPDLEPILGPYLLSGGGSDVLEYLEEAYEDLSDEPLAAYLLGRRLAFSARHADALPMLQRTLSLLPEEQPGAAPADVEQTWIAPIRRETWRLLGHALFALEAYDSARAAFERAAELAPWDGYRARHLDWARRATWKLAQHPSPVSPP